MGSDHEAEIRASVAARADLGPAYDDAVAEGLVERIGAEIDKRIDARLGQFGATGAPGPPVPSAPGGLAPGYQGPAAPAGAQPGAPRPAGAVPPGAAAPVAPRPAAQPGLPGVPPPPAGYPGYPGYQGYLGPVLPPGYQPGPPPSRPSEIATRNVATTITALGSMALGVAATAIVSHAANVGGQGFIILLIWAAIAVINIVYARRP
ncbi:MAG TPA: hypothetical protein VFQ68_07555 [Streptosporangiaceae bacterium]|nr:hypothetical protein [Streptosporangiaceae bacterium]